MSDEVLRTIANNLEPIGPCRQELVYIAPGKAWATISFDADDFSTKPVLFGHLKKLPSHFDVRMIELACSEWNGEMQNLDTLRTVINGETFAWAEDDEYFENGQIEIVGDTDTVKAVGSQICENPTVYEMPAVGEIFPPLAEGLVWREVKADRGKLDLGQLHQFLRSLPGKELNTLFPLRDSRAELFAAIENDVFLRAATNREDKNRHADLARAFGFDEPITDSLVLMGRKESVTQLLSMIETVGLL